MKQSRSEIEKIINEIKDKDLRIFLIKVMIDSDDVYELVRRNFINYFPRLTYNEKIYMML